MPNSTWEKIWRIRPIAIGYTFCHIAAKCANNFVLTVLGKKLLPEQLGLGCPGGCEAAVHATRRFMSNMLADFVMAKLDFSNAFNSLCRDVMLSAWAANISDSYRFCHIAYDKPTHLKLFSHTIILARRCSTRWSSGYAIFLLVDSFSVVVQKSLEDCLFGRYNPRRSFTRCSSWCHNDKNWRRSQRIYLKRKEMWSNYVVCFRLYHLLS